jgi:hypothetical protein
MAAQSNRVPREVVDFPANVPVTVALKYAQGKTISTMHGERMMFSLPDGRVMFLDLEVASQIVTLGINVHESFTITRKWDGQQGSPVSWEVARLAGEPPKGTLVVPAVSAKPLASAPAACEVVSRQSGRTLIEEAQSLVDVFATVWKYTRETYRDQVKPEEVRSFVTTAYIQRGRSAAA